MKAIHEVYIKAGCLSSFSISCVFALSFKGTAAMFKNEVFTSLFVVLPIGCSEQTGSSRFFKTYFIVCFEMCHLLKLRCDRRSCNRNLSNFKLQPNRNFPGFNGITTHSLCPSAAVPYQLSYEDPHVGSKPIYRAHLYPRQQ